MKENELDLGEIEDISVDSTGAVLPAKGDKIALLDADTIVYSSASVLASYEDLLPKNMYTPSEWDQIKADPGFDEENWRLGYLNIEEAIQHSEEKIQFILDRIGCKDFEAHFTRGRKSFPYTMVDKDYKGNRKDGEAPYGLSELKEAFCAKYPDKAFQNWDWEADHIVVCKKRDNYDKYVLCAVDKDVLKALPGAMFNYYQSTLYKIDMKWIHNTEIEAMKRYYVQTLTGDTGDNVIGLHGIGPKKAEKALKRCKNTYECWEVVKSMYDKHDRGIIDAITNMRLVDMRQLKYNEALGDYEVDLWHPPKGEDDE